MLGKHFTIKSQLLKHFVFVFKDSRVLPRLDLDL